MSNPEKANVDAKTEVHVEIGGSSLNIKITGEGVIMDAFDNDLNEPLGSLAMTYDEWFDYIIDNDPANIRYGGVLPPQEEMSK